MVVINSNEFLYRVSDKGMFLERDGELYSEAYDPIPLAYEREYIETDIPIDSEEEPIEEDIANEE